MCYVMEMAIYQNVVLPLSTRKRAQRFFASPPGFVPRFRIRPMIVTFWLAQKLRMTQVFQYKFNNIRANGGFHGRDGMVAALKAARRQTND
jgi:pyridoxine/pyridoxamine 5'-phosphate oxidase